MSNVLVRVQNVNLFLEGVLEKAVRDEIQKKLSFVIPNYKFLNKYKQDKEKQRLGLLDGEPWDGTIAIAKRYFNENRTGILYAPAGLLSYVKAILDNNNVVYTIRDERRRVIKTLGYSTPDLVLRDYQTKAVEQALNRGRGVLKASTGCHLSGQGILMYDSSIKRVEDIIVGDSLMGMDNSPRKVTELCRGCGNMYRVIPVKGKSFIVNEDHILTLKLSGTNSTIVDVKLKDWLEWKTYKKDAYKLFRTDFTSNEMIGFCTEYVGIDDFFGFVLDGDGRYLLDDFTVTHNSGKTEMIVSTVAQASIFPSIFYVTSCDLLEQAYDRFSKYMMYNGEPVRIGRVGGGHCDIQPITIATVQTSQRVLEDTFTKNTFDDYCPDDKTKLDEKQKAEVKDLIKQAQFVYVDECQHVSCKTIQSIMNASHRAMIRIGGSASPWRDDGLDILIEACFGRLICDIDASYLIKRGYLIKPYITFNHFNQELGPAEDWHAHYRTYVVNNDARNQWIAERAKFHTERGRPTIVLVKWSQHAEILSEMIEGSEVLTSSGKKKRSPKRRKEILDKMRAKEVMCIIGTTLIDEGIDVPSASAGIFAGGGKSSTRELQRVGRFIRKDPMDPDKNSAFIDEIHDHTRWLSYQAVMRKKILRTEREFDIGDSRII